MSVDTASIPQAPPGRIVLPQYFKCLEAGLKPPYGTGPAYVPGKRRSARGALVPCSSGIHACTLAQLPAWLNEVICPILDASEDRNTDHADKVVFRWAVLGEPFPTWNETTARLFAADCAEHVLPIFGKLQPDDDRPCRAIEAARAFARGQITADERSAAWSASGSAAWSAAESAAESAELAWQSERLGLYLSGELS